MSIKWNVISSFFHPFFSLPITIYERVDQCYIHTFIIITTRESREESGAE